MSPGAERQQPVDAPGHLEHLGVWAELPRVPVGGSVAEQHPVSTADGRLPDHDIPRRHPAQALDGRCEAQQLLDGSRHERRRVEKSATLVRVDGEELRRAGQEPGRRVVAAGDQHEGIPEDPLQAEACPRIVSLQQCRDEVVRRLVPAPIDELGEVSIQLAERRSRLRGLPASALHDCFGPAVEQVPVFLGHTQEMGNHPTGDGAGDAGNEVGLAHLPQLAQAGPNELAQVGFQSGDVPGGEASAHQAAPP